MASVCYLVFFFGADFYQTVRSGTGINIWISMRVWIIQDRNSPVSETMELETTHGHEKANSRHF